MAEWIFVCASPTSTPTVVTTLEAACTDAGGVPSLVLSDTGVLPELSLEGAGLIAAAVIGLWSVAWFFRVFKKQIEES